MSFFPAGPSGTALSRGRTCPCGCRPLPSRPRCRLRRECAAAASRSADDSAASPHAMKLVLVRERCTVARAIAPLQVRLVGDAVSRYLPWGWPRCVTASLNRAGARCCCRPRSARSAMRLLHAASSAARVRQNLSSSWGCPRVAIDRQRPGIPRRVLVFEILVVRQFQLVRDGPTSTLPTRSRIPQVGRGSSNQWSRALRCTHTSCASPTHE